MPSDHLSDEDRVELDSILETIDFDNALKTLNTMREGADCRTELVSDEDGVLHVRKTVPHDPDVLSRGLALMGVNSPYLARVERCYQMDDSDIMIVEYVPGLTLRSQVVKSGPMRMEEALKLFEEMAEGARALHGATPNPLVHRDINPDNIILRNKDDGTLHACLIDYSITRIVRDDAQTDTRHLGTQSYASPEQYGFKQTDARSDIFSLGLVLMFMMTAQDPSFDGDGFPKEVESLPDALRQIVCKCTAFDPAQRYSPDAELLADIANVIGPKPEPKGKSSSPDDFVSPEPNLAGQQSANLFLWQRIKNTVGQGRGRAIWNIWRSVISAICVVLIISFVAVVINPSHGNTGTDNLVIAIATTVFIMLPVYVLITDFCSFWERHLDEHPALRTILLLVGSFLIFWILLAVFQACKVVFGS